MKGTEKQIKWATSILEDYKRDAEQRIADNKVYIDYIKSLDDISEEQKAEVIEEIQWRIDGAKEYIRQIDSAPEKYTAGQIIDNRDRLNCCKRFEEYFVKHEGKLP